MKAGLRGKPETVEQSGNRKGAEGEEEAGVALVGLVASPATGKGNPPRP